MSCLILFKSITYAQNGNARLLKNGINSYLMRKPASLAGKSCGFALKINCSDIERAKKLLIENGIAFSSCWKLSSGKWYEI